MTSEAEEPDADLAPSRGICCAELLVRKVAEGGTGTGGATRRFLLPSSLGALEVFRTLNEEPSILSSKYSEERFWATTGALVRVTRACDGASDEPDTEGELEPVEPTLREVTAGPGRLGTSERVR